MNPPEVALDQLQHQVRDDALYERGRELAEQGAVLAAWRRGKRLLAHVQGSEPLPYSVTLDPPLSGRRWTATCTCAYNEIYHTLCKHAVAVLHLWGTRPEEFSVEPTLDEEVAGPERERWLTMIREALLADASVAYHLALPPERRRPLRRAVNLAPYVEQLRFAFMRQHEPARQAQFARSLLESAAGYQRVGDSANAVRVLTLLVERLIQEEDKAFARLMRTALSLLELAGLDAEWGDDEHSAWIGRLLVWWGQAAGAPVVADRLLDLILHTYRPAGEGQVISWLRAQLRRPIHANQRSQRLWRERVRAFLMAHYEARADSEALLELCWEEGDDRRAAITLARQGDSAEVLRLARAGLGDATTHRIVAELLAERGHRVEAQNVAHAGRGYRDRGRPALLTWLAREAASRGDAAQGYADACEAWQNAPTVERYLLVRELNPSPKVREALLAFARGRKSKELLIRLLIIEERWEDAASLLPESGARRAELTQLLASRISEAQPSRAIELLFDLADLHALAGTQASYAQSIRAIMGAHTVAHNQAGGSVFATLLQEFKNQHRRRRRLLADLVASGIE